MYFSGACCDKLQVHSKEKEAFSHSKYVGDFLFQETPEGDPVICNEAAVFKHNNGKLFLYRNKDGDWVVGKNISQTEIIIRKHPLHCQEESLETTRRVFTCGARTRTAHPSSRSVPVR